MSKYLISSISLITLILGIGIGYYISPNYQMNSYYNTTMTTLGAADRYVDLRYINMMIAHHKGAIALAQQANNESQRQEIKNLATDILNSEPKAIEELYQWKKNWYNDTKEVNSKNVPNLGNYDENFDWRFLNALINHHKDGLEMTKEIKLKSTKNEILNNANAVEEFLNSGIKMLSEWRSEWYKIN